MSFYLHKKKILKKNQLAMTVFLGQDAVESYFNAQSELASDHPTETQLGLDLQSKPSEKQIWQFVAEELL